MTPDEIAQYLIEHIDDQDLDIIIARLHAQQQLSQDVIRALTQKGYQASHSTPRDHLAIARLSYSVSEAMGTDESRALAQWNIGAAFQTLNQYEDALTYYSTAVVHYDALGDALGVAGLKINEAMILINMGDYRKAIKIAAEVRQILAGEQSERAVRYLANLELMIGYAHGEVGEFARALEIYSQGRLRYQELDDHVAIARIDANEANLMVTMDRFRSAEKLLLKSRATFESEGHLVSVARADLNLGRLYTRMGLQMKAAHCFEKAMQGFESIPDDIEVAVVKELQLSVYSKLNLNREMMTLASEAEHIFAKNKMTREQISCIYHRGIAAMALGDLQTASELLDKVRKMLYRQGAWSKLWLVDIHRAELAFSMGKVSTARRIARRLERKLDADLQPEPTARLNILLARCAVSGKEPDMVGALSRLRHVVEIAQKFGLKELSIVGRYHHADVSLAVGEEERAWVLMHEAVSASYELQSQLLLDEFQLNYMQDKLALYRRFLTLAHRRKQAGKLSQSEFFDCLTMIQTLPVCENDLYSNRGDRKIEAQLNELRQKWHWHRSKLSSGTDGALESAKESRRILLDIESEFIELRQRDRLQKLDVGEDKDSVRLANEEPLLQRIMSQLGEEEGFIQFFDLEDQVNVIIVKNGSVNELSLPVTAEKIEKLLSAWHFQVNHVEDNSVEPDVMSTAEVLDWHLSRFYLALWEPIEALLDAINHLYIALPPKWQELPIAGFKDQRAYLISRYAISYVTSTEALTRVRSGTDEVSPSVERAAWVLGCSSDGQVPNAILEAQVVAERLRESWQVEMRLESRVDSQAIACAAREANLIHFATHAEFRVDNPQFSSLAIGESIVTMADLYRMPLKQNPFVILSACSTARGKAIGGGVIGMARSLLLVGASELLLAQWPIDDILTVGIMASFVEKIGAEAHLSAKNISKMLQQTQIEAIHKGESPRHWASFVIVAG